MVCDTCGSPLPQDARFCPRCGAGRPREGVSEAVPSTDAELALGLRQGDQEAYSALYERYARPVHDFVARMLRNPSLAEEVTQATFVQVWEKRETLHTPGAIRGWIYQIAHNYALKQVSRGPATVAIQRQWQLAALEPGPEQAAESGDAARLVWDAAASLEARQRAILELSVRRGLDSGEIAEILEVDTARASLNVNRAREALGNAVRYLLVARQRSHCERLAELVPAGIRQLTPDQRATVDHHMRRCPTCQGMALRLTAPEQLFGALVLLPLPERLIAPPYAALTAAQLGPTITAPTAPAAPRATVSSQTPAALPTPGPRTPRQISVPRAAIAAVVAVAVVAGVAFGITRITQSSETGTAAQSSGSAVTASSAPDSSGGAGGGIQGNLTVYSVPTANSRPEYIAVGPDGDLWFTENSGNKIGRISTAGAITEFPLPAPNSDPMGITAGPGGALWFDEGSGGIGRISTSGAITEYPLPMSDGASNGIAAGPDGAIWFTDPENNAIGRMSTSGTVTEYPIPTPASEPDAITAGPDGDIWFTEAAVGQIGRLSMSGDITEYPLPTPDKGLYDITTGPDGAVWFTDLLGNKIGRISTSGAITEYPGPVDGAPQNITAGPGKALWFTGFGGNDIGSISTSGVFTEYPIQETFSDPTDITEGPDGALWFTAIQGNFIGRLS